MKTDRSDAVHREALRLWWEREATLPRHARRAPDALDVATGVWGAMLVLAERGVRPTEVTR